MAQPQKNVEWRATEIDDTPMIAEEGDIVSRLRIVKERYYKCANDILQKHIDPDTGQLDPEYHDIVAWYREQGDRVNLLIPEDRRNNEDSICTGSRIDKEGSSGDGIDNTGGLSQAGLGEDINKDSITELSGKSKTEVNSGTSTNT